jgi:hypothetical protein
MLWIFRTYYTLHNATSRWSIMSRLFSPRYPNVRTCSYAVQAYMYARARPTRLSYGDLGRALSMEFTPKVNDARDERWHRIALCTTVLLQPYRVCKDRSNRCCLVTVGQTCSCNATGVTINAFIGVLRTLQKTNCEGSMQP